MIWGGRRTTRAPWPHGRTVRIDEAYSDARPVGPTFGPWADHEARCQCTVCR